MQLIRCTSAVRPLDGAALLLQPGRRLGALELLHTAQSISEFVFKGQTGSSDPHKVDFLPLTVWKPPDWNQQSEEVETAPICHPIGQKSGGRGGRLLLSKNQFCVK